MSSEQVRVEAAKLSLEISKKAFERFKDRRIYEWKMTFVIWAWLVSTFLLFKDQTAFSKALYKDGLCCLEVIGILLFVTVGPAFLHWLVHVCWLQDNAKKELKLSFCMEKMAVELMGGSQSVLLSIREAETTYQGDEDCPQGDRFPWYFQLAVTFSLSVIDSILIFYVARVAHENELLSISLYKLTI